MPETLEGQLLIAPTDADQAATGFVGAGGQGPHKRCALDGCTSDQQALVWLHVQAHPNDQIGVMLEFLLESKGHAGILSERGQVTSYGSQVMGLEFGFRFALLARFTLRA